MFTETRNWISSTARFFVVKRMNETHQPLPGSAPGGFSRDARTPVGIDDPSVMMKPGSSPYGVPMGVSNPLVDMSPGSPGHSHDTNSARRGALPSVILAIVLIVQLGAASTLGILAYRQHQANAGVVEKIQMVGEQTEDL